VREKYCWLAGAGDWCWFGVRQKYCWLDADEQSEARGALSAASLIKAASPWFLMTSPSAMG